MSALRHVMILASAGSGKTYALTSRFVQLLAMGAAPERIVALTFTRKAAGEFFDEILHKLARAAGDSGVASAVAADIGMPSLTTADFLALLRKMVDAMHRLRLGTLDSFFARIARTFPLELGLAGEFEVLQEHAARVERQRVLRRMFSRTSTGLDPAQAEFVEAFKRATFGAEEKQLGARLDAFLDQYQENFLAAPAAELWGDPLRIWPDGSPWLDESGKLGEAVRELQAALGELTDGQRERWTNFFTALAEWTAGTVLPPAMEYIVKNALAVWNDICSGQALITVDRRKLEMPASACHALKRIITHIVGSELRRHLETTRGIHAVLNSYETHYNDSVRRVGRLTFADVQRLLRPDGGAPILTGKVRASAIKVDDSGAAGAALGRTESAAEASPEDDQLALPLQDGGPGDGSSEPAHAQLAAEAGERRLAIDYRLDAEIDHWLLDEFQDTSFGQWAVLRNLIDEVVQDPEGRRSFFCVGDVKQAIYAWREGDPRLFREIFNHYNAAAPGAIEEQHLVASWRSGPPLIAMVNAVFGSTYTLNELFPGDAATTWNREWRMHESAVPQRHGQAALLHAEDEFDRWTTTRRLLEELQPLQRGLTCAILVKKNSTAAALAEFLRGAGIPAIAESDLHVATDNPLGAALLALVQAVAHPGDTLAHEQLRMTPLGPLLEQRELATPEALTPFVLRQIHADGFERAMRFWTAELEPRLAPDDAFSRRRAREFVTAAGLFDATGSRDLGEFIAFMERHTVRAPESAAVVRVMTIHKSKGLGFDVVIVPDLEGNRIDEKRDGLAVQKAPDRAVQWVLDLPPKLFCGNDAVLAAYIREAEADACYENLSLLYVALTRGKRALYVITEPVGKSKSRNFPRLLAATLGETSEEVRVGGQTFVGAWTSGDPDWHVRLAPAIEPAADVRSGLQPLDPGTVGRVNRAAGRRPSAARTTRMAAAALFSLDATAGAEFGTALHALLAQVEWATAADATHWQDRWQAAGHDGSVVSVAVATLAAAALAEVWRQPREAAEVWRERSFEIVLDGTWVTGVFDRVIVTRDAAGRPKRAVVYDFKTDRLASDAEVAGAVERYRDQVETYRRVTAVLTGLPPQAVECRLVFTAEGAAVTVSAPLKFGSTAPGGTRTLTVR